LQAQLDTLSALLVQCLSASCCGGNGSVSREFASMAADDDVKETAEREADEAEVAMDN
jgi:hypothetical protein